MSRSLLISLFFWASWASGQTPRSDGTADLQLLDQDTETSRVRLSLSPDFGGAVGTGRSALGYGMGLALTYALTERWGIAAGFRQTFYISNGISPMFSQIDLRAVYSLKGSLLKESTRIAVDREAVYSAEPSRKGGFQLQGCLSQFLYNADYTIVQMTGLGAAALYEFPASGTLAYHIGARVDVTFNRQFLLVPFQVFGGISLWL